MQLILQESWSCGLQSLEIDMGGQAIYVTRGGHGMRLPSSLDVDTRSHIPTWTHTHAHVHTETRSDASITAAIPTTTVPFDGHTLVVPTLVVPTPRASHTRLVDSPQSTSRSLRHQPRTQVPSLPPRVLSHAFGPRSLEQARAVVIHRSLVVVSLLLFASQESSLPTVHSPSPMDKSALVWPCSWFLVTLPLSTSKESLGRMVDTVPVT